MIRRKPLGRGAVLARLLLAESRACLYLYILTGSDCHSEEFKHGVFLLLLSIIDWNSIEKVRNLMLLNPLRPSSPMIQGYSYVSSSWANSFGSTALFGSYRRVTLSLQTPVGS